MTGENISQPDVHGLHGSHEKPSRERLYFLSLIVGALGVVFGDIGTSPLYAMRECFFGPHRVALTEDNILGILSLIFWSLVITISCKYLSYVMRAANRGEGGVLALTALALSSERIGGTWREKYIVALGLFGAALLYGDGMLTPAISVLSAVEGLNTLTTAFEPYIVTITVFILFGLFYFQSHGTSLLGAIFGPVIVCWFVVLGCLGIFGITQAPIVLSALLPHHAVRFFLENGWHGFVVLGSVFLVITGGESLYADMGHFGRKPIQIGWFALAFPGLMLNYLGQGATLIIKGEAASNPFYHLAPNWMVLPLVLLATLATVTASQAVISGAFSITRQAVQLGYLPRLEIRHTSSREIGQIYVPYINWMLLAATIWLVVTFRSSSNLAAAYGIAVVTTMVITSILTHVVAREIWKLNIFIGLFITTIFLTTDLVFFASNILKIGQGGWFPIAIGVIFFTVMMTWRDGRRILRDRLQDQMFPLGRFLRDIGSSKDLRVKGTSIFMCQSSEGTPPALLHNLKHNKVLHERVILLTVITEEVPYVPAVERLNVKDLGDGFYRIVLHFGFKDEPNVPEALLGVRAAGLSFGLEDATYFLGRETLFATKRPGMAMWRERLFGVMSQTAQKATGYYRLRPEQVIEIGMQIEL